MLTNLERVERITQIRTLKNDGLSYSVIAKRFNLSRQRIAQILRAPKLDRQAIISNSQNKCEKCGCQIEGRNAHLHHVDYLSNKLQVLCLPCHMGEHRYKDEYPPILWACDECGKEYYIKQGVFRWCSRECQENFFLVTLVCETCGKVFTRKSNMLERQIVKGHITHFFCSAECSRNRNQIHTYHMFCKLKVK